MAIKIKNRITIVQVMLMEQEYKTRIDTDNHSFEKIELVHSGEDFFNRLLCIISNAKSELHLQTYIFEKDATGKEVVQALKEAALRNVKVYVLLDGYGSASLSKIYTAYPIAFNAFWEKSVGNRTCFIVVLLRLITHPTMHS